MDKELEALVEDEGQKPDEPSTDDNHEIIEGMGT